MFIQCKTTNSNKKIQALYLVFVEDFCIFDIAIDSQCLKLLTVHINILPII